MSDQYLWDKSGVQGREIQDLEELLGQFRHRSPIKRPPVWQMPRRGWWLPAAAALAVCSVAIPLSLRGPVSDWRYTAVKNEAIQVRTGQTLDTGASTATLESRLTGELQIKPNSRLRLVASGDRQQRFELEQGTIHALIWAPPGKFIVDTPVARTIDLGCRYTLQMSKSGEGVLSVDIGWVAFEWQGVESFIPAGASSKTNPKKGPETPWFTDAFPELQSALVAFDAGQGSLESALRNARVRHAMTVWHLMTRSKGEAPSQAYNVLAELTPLPAEAGREAILAGKSEAIYAAWDALGLGSAEIWRTWKRSW